MKPIARIALLLLLLAPGRASAQIVLGGQSSVQFLRSAPTESERVLNGGRPTFGFWGYLFVDGYVNDHVAGLMNLRLSDNGTIALDYLAIRLSRLTSLELNLQAGKFDLPFGNLGERRFPRNNPLFSLPIIYEYRTTLPDHVPTETDLLANRGRGSGMRLLDDAMYDLGAEVFGSAGPVDYAVEMSNGTVSSTSYYTENQNNDFGKLLRLAVTPFTGLTVGGAYTWGAYLEQGGQPSTRSIDINAYRQKAAEVDIAFSRGHAVFNGEGVISTWPVPFDAGDQNLTALGFSLEGKMTLIPRLYAALRMSGLHFGNAVFQDTTQPWDYDVTEWEGGIGWFLERDVLVKLVRRETRIHGGSYPKDNLTVVQLVVAY